MSAAPAGEGKATVSASQAQMGRKRFLLKKREREREREKGMNDLVVIAERKKEVHGGQDITAAVY